MTHVQVTWKPAFGLLAILFLASSSLAAEPKVQICHLPPGDPQHPQLITIAQSAVAAHLAHGDSLTEICDDGLDNDCDGLIDGDDPDCVVEPPPHVPTCPCYGLDDIGPVDECGFAGGAELLVSDGFGNVFVVCLPGNTACGGDLSCSSTLGVSLSISLDEALACGAVLDQRASEDGVSCTQ